MPIYEYLCPDCGVPFEKRVSMADADNVKCPACGSPKPTRKLSRVMIKGSPSASSASNGAMPAPAAAPT